MARRIKTVSASGAATSSGGYVHPACICHTIHCSPCYITNFTSHQDSCECSMPSEGAQWVTLISECGADVTSYNGACVDFNYDYYNYQEVCVDIILYNTATSGSAGVYVGSTDYLHCLCYPYMFATYCGNVGGRCCFGQLACTNCLCKYVHFTASFRPSMGCTDQSVIGSGGTNPPIGGNKFSFGGLGSYVGLASHDSVVFHICSYNQQLGNQCMFWCNFQRLRFFSGGNYCKSPHNVDKIHIAGKPYKNYTPGS